MKVELKFDLSDEGDREDHVHALRAGDYRRVLIDLAMAFRAHRKYDSEPVTEERFLAILAEHGVEV